MLRFLEAGRNFHRWNLRRLTPALPRVGRPDVNQILVLNRRVASRTRESGSADDLNLIWDKPFWRGRKKRRQRQQREPQWGRSGGKPTASSHNKNMGKKNKEIDRERQQPAPLKRLFLFLCNATMVLRHHDVVYTSVDAQNRAPSLSLL